MPKGKDILLAEIKEYQLMVEEVLGGMDIMISQLDKRVSAIEKLIDIIAQKNLKDPNSQINSLKGEFSVMKEEFTAGLNLAFKLISEK
jgi:hypothetical protein